MAQKFFFSYFDFNFFFFYKFYDFDYFFLNEIIFLNGIIFFKFNYMKGKFTSFFYKKCPSLFLIKHYTCIYTNYLVKI